MVGILNTTEKYRNLLFDLAPNFQQLGHEAKLQVGNAACDGILPYFFNAVWEEFADNARDSVKTKAAWR